MFIKPKAASFLHLKRDEDKVRAGLTDVYQALLLRNP